MSDPGVGKVRQLLTRVGQHVGHWGGESYVTLSKS